MMSLKEKIFQKLCPKIFQEQKNRATYFIIIMVAFTQGVLYLSDLGINYLYKDDFHLKPAQVSICLAFTSFPWIVKPLWGVISDSFLFFGYRRKSYLIFFGFLQCLCWLCLATWNLHPIQGITLLITVQISVAFCNVIGEALLVEISRKQSQNEEKNEQDKQGEASKNVSLFFGVRSVGVFLTAYTGGILLEYLNKKSIFAITSTFPFILALGGFFLPEKKQTHNSQTIKKQNDQETSQEIQHEENENLLNSHHDQESQLQKNLSQSISNIYKEIQTSFDQENDQFKQNNMKKVIDFISQKEILYPIIFIFIFMSTPNTGSSMFYYYTNFLKFQPEFMGQLKLIHALANIVGIYIYNKYLKFISFKKLFVSSSFICCITGLSQIILVTRQNQYLGIPDKFFSIGDSLIIQTFAEINTIPLLVLACRLCPQNIEGTMYALLMATINFGSMMAYQLGGILIYILGITENQFSNLWILILIANITTILPLPFIIFVNFDSSGIEEKLKQKKAIAKQDKMLDQEKQTQLQDQNQIFIQGESGMPKNIEDYIQSSQKDISQRSIEK